MQIADQFDALRHEFEGEASTIREAGEQAFIRHLDHALAQEIPDEQERRELAAELWGRTPPSASGADR
ncbi:hypothetical protein AWB85_06270 [Mycobacteroides immunogenum]|uniref:Uncharacterized protein n=1 Tax=Mycobacteroides immunogenum TaxID=83262 RepID=A0A179VI98_9MYCO|nr:hypothetical protein [Mycobacteroides immunogenum]OAT70882.1 hypothetical protein AWB85_06270 [Mycobacteroides immunogenum]